MMNDSLTRRGFKQSDVDNCLYSYHQGGETIYLLTHVDDILAATTNEEALDNLMKDVGQDFEVKCVGDASEYLGIRIERDSMGRFKISQEKFIDTIIETAGLKDARTSKFPIDTGYYKLQGKQLPSNEEYRKLIGMLLYLATNTRPDIAATVAILSQKVMEPRDIDLHEAKRMVRYLKGTKDHKLTLNNDDEASELEVYSDADWAEDTTDRKSNSGYIIRLNGGTIGWSCKKQNVVAQSSAESEFIALTEAVKEAVWVNRLTEHFQYKTAGAIKILTDSQSAIAMVENQRFSHRTKHIDTKYHFIRDLSEKGEIKLKYHPTSTNIADMLTKPLAGNKIQNLRELAGLL
jgi:hypothetical protein